MSKALEAISKFFVNTATQAPTAVAVGTLLSSAGYGPLSLGVMGLGAAGLFAYDLWNGIVQGQTVDEVREHARQTLNLQQRQAAGMGLATDNLARQLGIPEAELLQVDDLRRPYDILVRFVQGEIDSLEQLTKELQATQNDTLAVVQKLAKTHQNLELQIAARLLGMESRLPRDLKRELMPQIAAEFEQLRRRILSPSPAGPTLRLVVRVYDPTVASHRESIDRFVYDRQRVPLFGRDQEFQQLREFLK